jgi:cell division protease FtsH
MSVPGPKPEFQNPGQRSVSQNISFSQLLNDVDQAKVRDVVIQGQEIHGTWTDSRGFNTYDSISVSSP